MKVVLIGGHLSPLLAVLDALPKITEVLVIGRKYALEGDNAVSLEYKTITERNIPFVSLTSGRLQRKLTKHTLTSLTKMPVGFLQALQILRTFKPDVVVSFGGYLSVPVAFACAFLRIPFLIHEQTMSAGMANKIASKLARKICISWESSRKYFPKEKVVLTGNPLRKFTVDSLSFVVEKNEEKLPIIYITGGSLGSHAINKLVEGCIEKLLQKYIVVHQTGDAKEFNDYDRLTTLRDSLSEKEKQHYILKKFIAPETVGSILQQATLVISRSGINTVTELLNFGKPCILIPLPHGQKNEQMINAQFVSSLKLGKILPQEEATAASLFFLIESMINNINQYKKEGEKAKEFIKPDAAQRIVSVIEDVVQKRS